MGGDARQRFHDSRGYGRPAGGNEIELSRVEAAHLLFRGDLDAVDGRGFREFFVSATAERERFALRFLVYVDLRERGFYLSPAREGWPGVQGDPDYDYVVYPRGKGPYDGVAEYRVRIVGERRSVAAADLPRNVLAVVDEESEITYLDVDRYEFEGRTDYDPPESLEAELLDDRAICWDAPDDLYERGFYGQPFSARTGTIDDALQLSLVEAAALAAQGVLTIGDGDDDGGGDDGDIADGEDGDGGFDAVVARGRAVEGERFDRRLRVYRALRERRVVPKTGFKFGADFRTYAEVESVENLGHSECLIRVVTPDHEFAPRDLALDVRLAGGVRKRMVFALTDANGGIDWISVARLTP